MGSARRTRQNTALAARICEAKLTELVTASVVALVLKVLARSASSVAVLLFAILFFLASLVFLLLLGVTLAVFRLALLFLRSHLAVLSTRHFTSALQLFLFPCSRLLLVLLVLIFLIPEPLVDPIRLGLTELSHFTFEFLLFLLLFLLVTFLALLLLDVVHFAFKICTHLQALVRVRLLLLLVLVSGVVFLLLATGADQLIFVGDLVAHILASSALAHTRAARLLGRTLALAFSFALAFFLIALWSPAKALAEKSASYCEEHTQHLHR
jgi:hypothetical protein